METYFRSDAMFSGLQDRLGVRECACVSLCLTMCVFLSAFPPIFKTSQVSLSTVIHYRGNLA